MVEVNSIYDPAAILTIASDDASAIPGEPLGSRPLGVRDNKLGQRKTDKPCGLSRPGSLIAAALGASLLATAGLQSPVDLLT
jgi:hypothetical protein